LFLIINPVKPRDFPARTPGLCVRNDLHLGFLQICEDAQVRKAANVVSIVGKVLLIIFQSFVQIKEIDAGFFVKQLQK